MASEVLPAPPELDKDFGRAAQWPPSGEKRGGPFSWIRFDNTEPCRSARRKIRDMTRCAVKSCEYIRNGHSVQLESVRDMMNETVIAAQSLGNLDMPSGPAKF